MPNFDEIWIQNRLRYRKTLKGSRLRTDDVTGYLEPSDRRGFMAAQRKQVVDWFRVCSNLSAIARGVNIDIQSIYDAIAVDPKFREDMRKCNENTHRSKQLNNELVKLAASEKTQVLTDLSNKLDKYRG